MPSHNAPAPSGARFGPRILLIPAGTLLGILLLIFLLRAVNLDQLGASFSNANYAYLLIAVVPFLGNLLLKVPRWALLLGEDAPGWDTLFGSINVGYAINALLPLRLGEVVRAYWIRDQGGIGMVRSLSTIALERVLDGVTLVILFMAMIPTVALPRQLLGPAIAIGAVFIAVLLGMLALAYGANREGHPLHSLMGRLESGRWAPIARALQQVITGLHALRSGQALALVLGYTVLIWASNVGLAWLVLEAFHIHVPLTAAILVVAVVNLGMAVPSSPGYIGQFEALMVLTLSLYGVHRAPALASALAFHAVAFVPVTIIGLVYIARVGLGMTLQMVRSGASRTLQGASDPSGGPP